MTNLKLGLDFGNVIFGSRTTRKLIPEVIENVAYLRRMFGTDNIYVISRVDNMQDHYRSVIDRFTQFDLFNKITKRDNVLFCLRRSEKAPICKELGITHFVDDHTEVLSYMKSVPYRYAFNTSYDELLRFPLEPGMKFFYNWDDMTKDILRSTM